MSGPTRDPNGENYPRSCEGGFAFRTGAFFGFVSTPYTAAVLQPYHMPISLHGRTLFASRPLIC